MPRRRGNVFTPSLEKHEGERIEEILAAPGLRVEKIVSKGDASPEGFWFDQEWDEWVLLLRGAARLRFESPEGTEEMMPGDYILIPAHARHRVDCTSPDEETVWLAVHFSKTPGP
jgi:cupin 2 domain-containing protein